MHWRKVLGTRPMPMLFCLAALAPAPASFAQPPAPEEAPPQAELGAQVASLPLAFEANVGQTDERVRFLARGTGCTLFLTDDEAVLRLNGERATSLVRLRLGGAAPFRLRAEDPLPGTSRYFRGDQRSSWGLEAPLARRAVAPAVYPGIDLVFYGTDQRALEYDLVVAPGADPDVIALELSGHEGLTLERDGHLLLATPSGALQQRAPVAWQEIEGRRTLVPCRYVLGDDGRVRFALGAFDRRATLVIDPQLVYSTVLGAGGLEMAWTFQMFGGFAYVAGHTTSVNFPLGTNAYDRVQNMNEDVFVTVFAPGSSTLLCSTYLGGSSNERPTAIAVNGAGLAHVTGWTDSTNFPVTSSRLRHAGREGFVLMLSPYVNGNAALAHSTYLGGDGDDECWDVELDGVSINYLTGYTRAANFPTTSNAYRRVNAGGADAFVTSLSPYTDAIVYSTYLGGAGDDYGGEIALNTGSLATVAGHTWSGNFPTTAGAFDRSFNGVSDVFVTKISPVGTQLAFSTLVGGADFEWPGTLELTPAGEPVVIGNTRSPGFPVTAGSYDTSYNGGAYGDAYVFKLNAAGTALVFSTFLGGTGSDGAGGLAIDSTGTLYLCGHTDSTNFPTVNPLQAANGGMWDCWLAKMNAAGTQLVWSTYFGGTANDASFEVSLVPTAARVFYCGYTGSNNYRVTNDAFDRTFNGGSYDATVFGLTMN